MSSEETSQDPQSVANSPPADNELPLTHAGNESNCRRELFVERRELQQLIGFATAARVSRRLRSVAGPPGYGKTCLLYQLEQYLLDHEELFVVRVPTNRSTSKKDLTDWLAEIVEKARKICPLVGKVNPTDEPEAVIGHLLEKLCETCSPTWRIILIVDALDEVPEHIRRELENRFLGQFWRKDCVRLVVSFRDDFKLKTHHLRRGERRIVLDTFTTDQGHQQLEKRAQVIPENLNTPFEELSQLVAPYKFNLPGLTTLLSQQVKKNEQNGQSPVLTAADLKVCWQLLIKQPLAETSGHAKILEADLKAIVLHSEDSWTFETFSRICNYSQNEAFPHWQELMALSVVAPHPIHKSRYMVIDGLREMLRAEISLREEER